MFSIMPSFRIRSLWKPVMSVLLPSDKLYWDQRKMSLFQTQTPFLLSLVNPQKSDHFIFASVWLSPRMSAFQIVPLPLSLHPSISLVLLSICTSVLPDLKWPASIPADAVTSWWRSSFNSVIRLCGADCHGMEVNTHPWKMLRFSCSSQQTE